MVAPRSAISRMGARIQSAGAAARRRCSTSAAVEPRCRPSARAVPSRSGPKRTRSQRDHRMADGLEHPPHLALAALEDRELDPVGREPLHAGWRGHAVVEPDALAQRPQRALSHRRVSDLRVVGARDLERGCMSRCASSPSSVSRISPVVSTSRRPTGYSRRELGTISTIVGRPCGSGAVDTTPRGLLTGRRRAGCPSPTRPRRRPRRARCRRRRAPGRARPRRRRSPGRRTRAARTRAARRRLVGEVLGEAHDGATIGDRGPRPARRHARRRR